jgi:Bacterial PH domain
VGLRTDPKMVFRTKDYSNHDRNAVGWNSLAAGFFDNSKEIDSTEINARFHSEIPLLLEEEKILRAFVQARDMFIYTNRRLVIVDTKGLSGQRVKYKSIPYKHIDGFVFETAGHLDRDAEIYTYSDISEIISDMIPRCVGMMITKQSILVKHTDIYEVGKLILDHTIFGDIPKKEMEPEIELIYS